MTLLFPSALPMTLPILGDERCFPVRRVFCVGRNYAEHAREMGAADQAAGLEPPFFFMKPGDALVSGGGVLRVDYPPATANLHHEVELVVALGGGGRDLSLSDAAATVWGYAVGLDLTRRDMQGKAKEKGHPWDMSKGFDQSAVCGPLHAQAEFGVLHQGRIALQVNGQLRQLGDLSDMMWKIPQIIANLSTLVALQAGDLIYTGTPSGVGPLQRGDRLLATVEGLTELALEIV